MPSPAAIIACGSATVSASRPGMPAMFSSGVPGAFASATGYAWLNISGRPMPASMPWTTAREIAWKNRPSFTRPRTIWRRPEKSTITPSMATPYSSTVSATSAARPAAGPLT